MMFISNNNWPAMSDPAILKTFGLFVKHHRLEQNKTQMQLSEEAGINRSTLSLFENGENASLITFIQLLRALKLLGILEEFRIHKQLSPIQLAKMEKSERIRARIKKNKNIKVKTKPKSDW